MKCTDSNCSCKQGSNGAGVIALLGLGLIAAGCVMALGGLAGAGIFVLVLAALQGGKNQPDYDM